MSSLSHLNAAGEAHMVDVSPKAETSREAVARARIEMRAETLALIQEGGLAKGDVLATARLAGLMAAKKTAEIIPLCHPLRITGQEIEFQVLGKTCLEIRARVRAFDRTGVEMEALTSASVAALTIYDMAKAVDRWMRITEIALLSKSGGKSGDQRRELGQAQSAQVIAPE
jgi:cyclic pyranopterin phosphate synthase